MGQYILRRLLQFIPVFLGVTLVLFVLTRVIPGDPVKLLAGERSQDPVVYEAITKAYGLDKPILVQYVNYLGSIVKGDFGQSIATSREVTTIFKEKYPYTVKLALAAIFVEIIIGIGAGVISALRPYSFLDALVTLSTSVLVSLPVFWLGMLLQYFFGIWLKRWTGATLYLPISGAHSATFPDWVHLILPAVTLASVSTAYAARIMRSQLLEVQGQDYVRTAYAKGLSSRAVLWGHSMKNALIPVVTFVALDLGAMLSGAILTETVFNWPGIGYTIFSAIGKRDWPVVIGSTIIVTLVFMVINLVVDIGYAFLDPRIRYDESKA
ncbi:MAG: ABC transporter permease [Coriobacteriaceae bacterium]|nr:ABC transporter permease [Coriobacteriaceae bacterium]